LPECNCSGPASLNKVEESVGVFGLPSLSFRTNSVACDLSPSEIPASSGILYTNAPDLSETIKSVECVGVFVYLSVSLGISSNVCDSFPSTLSLSDCSASSGILCINASGPPEVIISVEDCIEGIKLPLISEG